MQEILAWHFLREDKKLGYEDNRLVSLGETITVDPDKLELCEYGLHGSIKILDALSFVDWGNAIVCRVKLSGKIIEEYDKLVASERTVIGWCEADRILHEFACRCAEDVLPIFEKEYPEDFRPRKTIEAKKLWLEGKLSLEDLQTANDAVSAARDMARDAANASAAAWAAARAAAWTTMSVAWYAGLTAAAARAAAGGVAWTTTRNIRVARAKYNSWLEEMVLENI